MPSTILDTYGEIKEIDILELLPPDEGEINIYYGRMGSGKTTIGTKNILEQLRRGQVVYANWNIRWNGYDERKNKFLILLGILGIKWNYYNFPKENFHFWDFTNQTIDGLRCADFITQLANLNDCQIHLDEGHIPFDSYEATRMSEQKRSAIFATRHFNRKLTVYTQRANSVHVNLRGNTNRFFKCETTFDHWLFKRHFVHFLITEFQDLTTSGAVDETCLEDEKGKPIRGEYKFGLSQKRYWGKRKLFEKYDTKYLRGDKPSSQENMGRRFFIPWKFRAQMWEQRNDD